MLFTARLFACIALIGATAGAEELVAPQISDRFPPREDLRSPDRTLATIDTQPVRTLSYSPDGRMLASAGGDNTVYLWDARTGEQGTGELLRKLEGHTGRVLAIAFSGGGKSLVSTGSDQTAKTWEVESGKLLNSVPFKFVDIAMKSKPIFLFAPGGEQIVQCSDKQIELRRVDSGAVIKKFELEDAVVTAAAISLDGKMLLVGTKTGVDLWDIASGRLTQHVGTDSPVKSLAASASHIAVGCANGNVKMWRIDDTAIKPMHMLNAHPGKVDAVSIRGDQLASAGDDKFAKVWDIATGQLLCTQVGHSTAVVSVAINGAHGQKMATGGTDGSIRYWTMPLPPIPPADVEKITAALPDKATATPKQPRRLLVFWRADAILHKGGVPAANKVIELLGQKTGAFSADFTRDYEALDDSVLANYDGLVLNSTAHLAIPPSAKQALLNFARNGKGVIGIHAAIDTFRDWPEGAAIVGATFGGHPWGPSGTWAVKLDEPEHVLMRAWEGKNFKMHDEFYELAAPYSRADRRVLMSLDMADEPTAGVKPLHRADKDFAVSWIKRYGQGRVFYCMFGHIGQPFQNRAVLQYYLDGIQYALGDLEADDTPKP